MIRLAGAGVILRSVHEVVAEFGVEYFKRAAREVIEESRRVVMDNIRNWMVPGTYEQCGFRVCKFKGLQKNFWERADTDTLIHMHMRTTVDARGRICNDMTGSSRWGYHAFNAFPGGVKVAFMLGLAGALFAYNTRNFTAGGNYAVTGVLQKFECTTPVRRWRPIPTPGRRCSGPRPWPTTRSYAASSCAATWRKPTP